MATLPTDPDRLYAWIARNAPGKRPLDQRMWKDIVDRLVASMYQPPKVRAAMFATLDKIPGTRLVKNTKDAAGRPAVGVTKEYDGSGGTILFDPRTYRWLGYRSSGSLAVMSIDIADSAPNQLPASSPSPGAPSPDPPGMPHPGAL